jgi:hypothetical protein
MFFVYFTNHGYYSDRRFETLDSALDYGKSKGFDCQIVQTSGGHPFKTKDACRVASWSVIGGTRR